MLTRGMTSKHSAKTATHIFRQGLCKVTLVATAFALFSDERDRSYEKWTLSKGLFDVAKKAVSDERSDRQQSIKQFITEWKAAKGADFTK